MAQRTGVPTLLKIAQELCKYVAKYGTVIGLLFPSNTALIAALAAANAACAELAAELAAVRETGD